MVPGHVRRLLIAGLAVLAACAPFREPPPPAPPPAAEDEVRLGHGWLEKKRMIEARGRFEDGVFAARTLKVKAEDHEVTMKGTVTGIEPGREVAVGGARIRIGGDSKFEEAGAGAIDAGRIAPGAWVKAETVFRDGALLLRKLTLRKRKDGEEEELQGLIEDVDRRRRRILVGDIEVAYDTSVPLSWDVADAPPPDAELRRLDAVAPGVDGIARVRHIDPEDQRPGSQYRPFEELAIGGEAKFESEWRGNHDLQELQERDRLIHDASLTLEFTGRWSERFYSFLKLRTGLGIVHFDEQRDLDEGGELEVQEFWVLLEDLPVPGVSLQIGRQDIDDRGREWLVDDQLDAIRAWFNFDVAVLELSVSEVLFETTPEEDGVTNFYAGLHAAPLDGQEFLLYAMHRQDGTLIDLDRTLLGVMGEGCIGDFSWWADAGWTSGHEDDLRIDGVGADVLAAWTFADWPLRPSVYGGLAYGSGDRDPFDGKDSRFRQSGLNDNQDRLLGKFSFRYLGELTRFDLQNLVVWTAGIDFRIASDTSLDLVWHHYRQEYALAALGPTRLRLTPDGSSRELGHEVDLLLGINSFDPVRIQLAIGYFQPGEAFGHVASDAWFGTFEVKLVF